MVNRHRDSASESETTRQNNKDKDGNSSNINGPSGTSTSSSKTTQKQKNQLAQQQQQNFLQKHINSNGPRDKPRVDPLDFEKFSDKTLLLYKDRYNFNLSRPESLNSDILNSEIGKKTYTKRNQLNQSRINTKNNKINKKEFANHVKNHFLSLNAKENDIITGFLYKVKHQDKEFKLTFQ
ncbi:uncharacterized protein KGF55_002216 [Candida pseudojiufengensis]|uniref:uncharacterized protein n=1 Tax=Candida pseudojiufengensis TaxID=497109 RepID=UPI002224ED5A|nr:uncharacterized protein KGF55_002216 [Candida pseudojiufengensis]KAI5964274.1 hypothetical protein KGF55_002216 [Candida pseudojiufengensis]